MTDSTLSQFCPEQRKMLEGDAKKAGYYWAVCMNRARKQVIRCGWSDAQRSYCLALEAAEILLNSKRSEAGSSDEFSENRYAQTAIEAIHSFRIDGDTEAAVSVAQDASDYLCSVDLSQARDPLVCSIIDCIESDQAEVEAWITEHLIAPYAKRQVLH